MSIIIIIIT